MNTQVISAADNLAIETACKILEGGGLVAFPTDTVYGLGCLVNNSNAIDKLYSVKERSKSKAIAVLIAEHTDLQGLTTDIPPLAAELAARFWPGALTLVFPKHPSLPENLSPLPTVGIRMPDHAFARSLMRLTGPLATTSANISGQNNPVNADEVLAQLDGRIDLVVDGGTVPGGIPSTVVDCTALIPRVLRVGAYSPEELGLASNESRD